MDTLDITKKKNYSIVQIKRKKSNAINSIMVKELRSVFNDAEKDDSVQGIILTGQKNFFSAGLDVIDLYHFNHEEMSSFWNDFISLLQEMSQFSKPFISAITGHSPAGGCLFALCSDYRIMIDNEKFRIGLNEVPVGILMPYSIFALYKFWLGERHAYQCIMSGSLLSPNEAQKVGLVDEVVVEEDVLKRAENKMQLFLSFPQSVWRQTKLNLRSKLKEEFKFEQKDLDMTLDQWWHKDSRTALENIVNRLTA